MISLIKFLLRTIQFFIRVHARLKSWKNKVHDFFSGKSGNRQSDGVTIDLSNIQDAGQDTKRKIFAKDEGTYVDFVEVKE